MTLSYTNVVGKHELNDAATAVVSLTTVDRRQFVGLVYYEFAILYKQHLNKFFFHSTNIIFLNQL